MQFHKPNYRSYPLLALTLITFACVFLTLRFRIAGIVIGAALFLFALLYLIRKRQIARLPIFALLLAFCIFRSIFAFHVADRALLQYADQTVHATVRLDTLCSQNAYYEQYECTFLSCNQASVFQRRGRITLPADTYALYSILEGELSLSWPPESSNGFRTRLYQYSNGILVYAQPKEGVLLQEGGRDFPLTFPILQLRHDMQSKLSLWGAPASDLASALLLGDKTELSPTIRTDFTQIGAAHVLAVSGMHLSVLTFLLLLLLRKSPLTKPWRTTISILALLFLALLTGASPSVLRAAALLICALLLSFADRRIHPLSTLAAVGLLFALLTPHLLFHVGFLLSYTATLGILLFFQGDASSASAPLLRLFGYFGGICKASLAAILFTLPVSMLFFGRISLWGFVSSLLLVPLCSICLYTILLYLCFPTAWLFQSTLSRVLALPLRAMIGVAQWLASYPVPSFFLHRSFTWVFLCIYLAILVLFVFRFPQQKRRFCILLILLCVLQGGLQGILHALQADALEIRFYVEAQDEVFLISDKNTHVLLDPTAKNDLLCASALSDLSEHHYQDAPSAVLFSKYTEHLPYLVSYLNSYHSIPCLWIPTPRNVWERQQAKRLSRLCEQCHISLSFYQDSVSIGALRFDFSAPLDFSVSKGSLQIAHFSADWNQSQGAIERFYRFRKDPATAAFLFAPGAYVPTYGLTDRLVFALSAPPPPGHREIFATSESAIA